MSTRRERWFCCTFESAQRRVTGAVQAWSAEAAVEQFACAVGEGEAGTITVQPGDLHLEHPASAAPPAAGGRGRRP